MNIIKRDNTGQVSGDWSSGELAYELGRLDGQFYLWVQKVVCDPRTSRPGNASVDWILIDPVLEDIGAWPEHDEHWATKFEEHFPSNKSNPAFYIAALRALNILEACGDGGGRRGRPSRRHPEFQLERWREEMLNAPPLDDPEESGNA